MYTSSTLYVIDASVAIKWFSHVNEADIEQALKLQELHLWKECLLIAPDILVYEIINALRYNPNFEQDDTNLALLSLLKMELELIKPDEDLLKRAIKLAYNKDTTIYDASYIALAQKKGCLLITADGKFFTKIQDLPQAILLKDLSLE
ncbi:MAG: type II toxin-antitoxin system VapC family toxin [Actinomycetota bacterium]|nr:type II toxin-antitoxin system VapC family toxin [Actinomycetota bacterium]MDI6821983.1 type II toxin-antitoxin system VapC family toxin [Actinomycetota bacterium]